MKKPHVAVFGAGAFGGWTALSLLRQGAQVSLIDPWGPGNPRASSGGETRLIRTVYGPDSCYTDLIQESWPRWRDLERQVGEQLYVPSGCLWMFPGDNSYVRLAQPHLEARKIPLEELSRTQTQTRFPWLRVDDLRSIFFEPEAGYLFARRACARVWEQFQREGGKVLHAAARPGPISAGQLEEIQLSDGTSYRADLFVFATGPWLGQTFPDLLGPLIRPSRQDVFFFGLEPHNAWVQTMPAWMDYGERILYGVADAEFRGFKAADDTRGTTIDPSQEERQPDQTALAHIRKGVQWRFPKIGSLPVIESRVCQYENSPDGQFIIDRHPQAANVRIVGGGSGHGFKLGPGLGHYLAQHILADSDTDPFWRLARFQNPSVRNEGQLRRS